MSEGFRMSVALEREERQREGRDVEIDDDDARYEAAREARWGW